MVSIPVFSKAGFYLIVKRRYVPEGLIKSSSCVKHNSSYTRIVCDTGNIWVIEEMDFVTQWLETGRDTNNYRGADKRGIYQNHSFQSIDFIPDITEQLEEGPKHLYMSPEEEIIVAIIYSPLCHLENVIAIFFIHVGRQISVGKIAE